MNENVKTIQNWLEKDLSVLIFSPANRFYLTEFNTSAGIIFITKQTALFFTDFRYIEKAKEAASIPVANSKDWVKTVNEIIAEQAIKGVFIETDFVSVERYDFLEKNLHAEISKGGDLVKFLRDLRSVKTNVEIGHIKAAQEITDQTFKYILPRIEVGRTEREIMLDMEFYIRRLGSEGIAFDFIVVSGKNSSLPHGVPTDKKIEKGDFVTMDFGAVINGYRSDMTRTVAVGSVTAEQKAVYDTVLEAQLAALGSIKTGVVCRDIDKIARDIIEQKYPHSFGHGLGHSVGIEIHEWPSLNTRCEAPLLENTIMTVEPGIYLEGKFGVRIEDMVIVKQNGCENITKSDKKLIIL